MTASLFRIGLVALLSACRSPFASDERVIKSAAFTMDTAGTVIDVAPPFTNAANRSTLCVALDTAKNVVELPHMVLRNRTASDTAHMTVAMDRRTTGVISISGTIETSSGNKADLRTMSYGSSHMLCLEPLVDSIARVRLTSTEPLSVRRVAFVTSNK